jgi:hypothetical protein
MRILIVFLGLVCAAAAVDAQRPSRPLPLFTVYDAAGAAATSATFAAARRTVVVFVRPGCRPCDQLLGTLARIAEPALASRVVLVIASPVEDAAAFAARSLPAGVEGAAWFADAGGEAWSALELKGLPVMMAVEGQRIEWTLSGAADKRLVESVVRSWLGMPGVRQ